MENESIPKIELKKKVSVINKNGEIVHQGIIESIENTDGRNVDILISGKSYEVSKWRDSKYVFVDEDKFKNNINHKVSYKYFKMLAVKMGYAMNELENEELKEINSLLEKIDAILEKAVLKTNKDNISYESFMSFHAHKELTKKDIEQEKLKSLFEDILRQQKESLFRSKSKTR